MESTGDYDLSPDWCPACARILMMARISPTLGGQVVTPQAGVGLA